MEWLVDTSDLHETHLMPCDDLRPHQPTSGCWCCPVERDDTPFGECDVFVHQAADGRNAHEIDGNPYH